MPYLVHVGEVVPKEIKLAIFPYHPKHDPNASCVYHAGYIGHSIHDFYVFKNKVHELLNQKLLAFTEEQLNVKKNSLPGHDGSAVNAIDDVEYTKVINEVSRVKTSMSIIKERLKDHGFLQDLHNDYNVCQMEPGQCNKLKNCVQTLMNQGVIQVTKK